jgi:hypothetical protein
MNNGKVKTVSVQANFRMTEVKLASASGRSQNRLHAQKALMEYLLLGRIES